MYDAALYDVGPGNQRIYFFAKVQGLICQGRTLKQLFLQSNTHRKSGNNAFSLENWVLKVKKKSCCLGRTSSGLAKMGHYWYGKHWIQPWNILNSDYYSSCHSNNWWIYKPVMGLPATFEGQILNFSKTLWLDIKKYFLRLHESSCKISKRLVEVSHLATLLTTCPTLAALSPSQYVLLEVTILHTE